MSGKLWKATKITVVAGLAIYGVSYFVGENDVADFTVDTVQGTSKGAGVGVGALRYAPGSFAEGVKLTGEPPNGATP
jgi:hypothetical protein